MLDTLSVSWSPGFPCLSYRSAGERWQGWKGHAAGPEPGSKIASFNDMFMLNIVFNTGYYIIFIDISIHSHPHIYGSWIKMLVPITHSPMFVLGQTAGAQHTGTAGITDHYGVWLQQWSSAKKCERSFFVELGLEALGCIMNGLILLCLIFICVKSVYISTV